MKRSVHTSAGEQNRYELDKLPSKVMNGFVLMRFDFNPTEDTVRDSGVIISGLGGTEWNDADYVPRYGEIVMLPDRLNFMRVDNMTEENLTEWGTEIEVEVGDTAYIGKMASANANSFVYDDTLYMLVQYSRIICVDRDGVLIPVNGYCLLEEVKEATRVTGLILDMNDKTDRRKGIVTHNGRNNDWYFGEFAEDACVDVGDELLFQGKFFGFLEADIFASLPQGMGYVQKRWISAKLN